MGTTSLQVRHPFVTPGIYVLRHAAVASYHVASAALRWRSETGRTKAREVRGWLDIRSEGDWNSSNKCTPEWVFWKTPSKDRANNDSGGLFD